jgi:hypothetical protein
MVVVGSRAPTELLAACGIHGGDTGKNRYGSRNAPVLKCWIVFIGG